jgi:eukaryotic-like serine/threonine-protein kinase
MREEQPSPSQAGVPGNLVGRERESRELSASLGDLMSGRGSLFLLAGEPGIGKTRLAEELGREASARGVRVAWGRCWEGGGAPAFWPWVQALRACLEGLDAKALKTELGAAAAHYVSRLVAEPGAAIPGALPPARAPEPIAALNAIEPEADRFRLFDAVGGFLRKLSAATPLLIIFDDLHAADDDSLLMLRFIARDLPRSRIMIIGTYREAEVRLVQHLAELIAQLGREGRSLALRGLAKPDVRRLVELGAGALPDDAALENLYRVTEGNPMFVTETVRLMLAEGRLQPAEPVQLGSFKIPDGIRTAILRRLELVSPQTREVLAVASVFGREFDLAIVGQVTGLSLGDLSAAVDEAVAAGLLEEVAESPGRHRFTHALTSQTLYDSHSRGRRRELHLQIAASLEDLYRGDLEPHLSELAHHYTQALPGAHTDKAIEYAERAAARAAELLGYQDAVQLYRSALKALALGQPNEQRHRCHLLIALGEVLYSAGSFEEARSSFSQAAEIATRLALADEFARAALGYAMLPSDAWNVDLRKVEMIQQALGALSEGNGALRAMLMARLAWELHWSEDRERRESLSREAVELARQLGDPLALVYVLIYRHFAIWGPETLEQRLADAAELKRLCEHPQAGSWLPLARYFTIADLLEAGDIDAADAEIGNFPASGDLLWGTFGYKERAVALRALMEGRFSEAKSLAEEALRIGQRLGVRAGNAFSDHMLALRREQGRLSELERGVASWVARYPLDLLGRGVLAVLYAESGRIDEARAELERAAVRGFSRAAGRSTWLAGIAMFSEVCARLGDAAVAATVYEQLLPYASHNVLTVINAWYGPVTYYLAILAAAASRFEQAAAHFEQALAYCQRIAARPFVARTQYQFARMLRARGAPHDHDTALALLGAALGGVCAMEMKGLERDIRELMAEIQPVAAAAPAQPLTSDAVARGKQATAAEAGSIEAIAETALAQPRDLRDHAAPDGTVTILFSDLENSSLLFDKLGDLRAQEILRAHNAIVREQVALQKGFEVKSMGDGFMFAFSSARRALLGAIGIQRALDAYCAQHADEPIRVRIGLHVGETIKESADFFGKTVILAARIAALAKGEEILVSSTLRELTESAGDFRFVAAGEVPLKGLSGTHRIYRVVWQSQA